MKSLFQSFLIATIALSINSCGNSESKTLETANADTLTAQPKDSMQTTVGAIPFPQKVEILLPTQYRKESTGYPKGVKEKEWYELYKDEQSDKWIVAKADLSIAYDRDECVDEDVMIIKSRHENAVCFFTPFEGLENNIVTLVSNQPLFPSYSVSFSMNNIAYKFDGMGKISDDETGKPLSPEAVKTKTPDELRDMKIKDYVLWFSNKKGDAYNLLTVETMEFTEPELIWAGDLNADGYPDAFFSVPSFYEEKHIYFFMSDPGDKENPFKKVADLKVINDC